MHVQTGQDYPKECWERKATITQEGEKAHRGVKEKLRLGGAPSRD